MNDRSRNGVAGGEGGRPPDTISPVGRNVDEKLLLSAVELSKVLGISRTTVWSLHSSGLIPLPVRLGRRTLWRVEEIHRWVDAGCPSREKWETMK